jgi:hypothetical protein
LSVSRKYKQVFAGLSSPNMTEYLLLGIEAVEMLLPRDLTPSTVEKMREWLTHLPSNLVPCNERKDGEEGI